MGTDQSNRGRRPRRRTPAANHDKQPDAPTTEAPSQQAPSKPTPKRSVKGVVRKEFKDLGLDPSFLRRLDAIGFKTPTPIQEGAIPPALAGRHVIGQARTGTGKTAAFGLPLLHKIDLDATHPQALVLAPTRELAGQIAEELERYFPSKKLKVATIYGGVGYEGQEEAIEGGAHIIVGTPGRIIDHMERGTLDLRQAAMLVLDEADRMLDMGFLEDVEWILRHMPSKHRRQTMLFSATMPEEIKRLTNRFMLSPVTVRVSSDELTVPAIEQVRIDVGRRNKLWALSRILDHEKGLGLTIVFCATKFMCDRLEGDLNKHGYKAQAIHGDLQQAKREKVLDQFERGELQVLIATDVAARGLDIDDVTHVINWDLPEQDLENYVHRIGRTGRAGKDGKAYSFVEPESMATLNRIELLTGSKLKRGQVPKGRDRVQRQMDWDELADGYGRVYVRLEAGANEGVDRYMIHHAVAEATGLQDQQIQPIRVHDRYATVAVPKERALGARDALRRLKLDGVRSQADFVDPTDA